MSLDAIMAKEWVNWTVPGTRPTGTMTTEPERQLIYYLASEYFTDVGHIVDTGCFLGGSTLAFGYGLQRWQQRTGRPPVHRIHAYDRFIAEDWMFIGHLGSDFTRGQSLLPAFRQATEPVAGLVEVHAGDIRSFGRPEGPIEILFVDVAKTPDLSDYVVREFFPALIPGRSIVIQQDYLYDFDAAGWLHVTMEYYAEYFRILTDTTYNSVAFLYESEIPKDRLLDNTLAALNANDKIRLLAGARARFSGLQEDLMTRAHWQYLESKHWQGVDPDAHRAAADAARFLLNRKGDSSEVGKIFGEIDRLGRELARSVKKADALEARLRSIENSPSWRLSAPVRSVGRALTALGLRR